MKSRAPNDHGPSVRLLQLSSMSNIYVVTLFEMVFPSRSNRDSVEVIMVATLARTSSTHTQSIKLVRHRQISMNTAGRRVAAATIVGGGSCGGGGPPSGRPHSLAHSHSHPFSLTSMTHLHTLQETGKRFGTIEERRTRWSNFSKCRNIVFEAF